MIKSYDFKIIEKEIRDYWRKIDLLKLLNKQNEKGDPYFLLDGPPYANNVAHIGHIRNTIYKDLYIRLAFMEGKKVLFQPGFDTHGLPIENMVEKKLKFTSKKDIVKFGTKKFCDECKESATIYKDDWLRVYDKLGSWYSWKDPYITYENNYLESTWWGFKQMWDKDMVYEGKKPVFWCPSCETALAGYEVSDKYEDVEDPLIIVKFRVKGTKDDYLLVYTTTPWTLPSNVVLVAKADEDYVKAKTDQGNLIIAKNLTKLFDELEIKFEIIEEFKGKKLEGVEYESLLDLPTQKELQKNKKALKVYMSIPILKERISAKVAQKKGVESGDVFEEFVSVEDGTGIVHCAPGHGKTDNLVGKHYGLPEISPLDDQCKFTEDAGIYQGIFVKEADEKIIKDLKEKELMLYNHKVKHAYPLCWRCSSPLIFRMSNQWFLKVDKIKEQMLKGNEQVDWQPDFAGERFQSWVENAEDWNFSRQRFWGIPIPIWKSEDAEYKVIGSIEELEKEIGKKLPKDFDLHTIGDLKLKSSKGLEMSAIGDIFDVWFDSGSAPFAAFHYPFENKELFNKHYPVNRINEAQDQIRGWFYSLMFIGVGAHNKAPYKIVSMPAWVVDKNGDKLSKSKGNYISAEEGIEAIGADTVRFYYNWDVDPAATSRFNEETAKTEVAKFHNILWNLHKLVITQAQTEIANGNELDLTQDITKLKLETEDEWIISKLSSTIKESKENYHSFKLHLVGRKIYEFVLEDLSRTYIQIVRERLEDDKNPLKVAYYCIMQLIKLLAPISPHITDAIYQNFKNELKHELKESVHLELIPEPNKINEELEADFTRILAVVRATLASRDSAKIGIRWPIKTMGIDTSDEDFKKSINSHKELILRFVNAKDLELKDMPKELEIKTHFKSLAEDFGEKTGDVATFIKQNEDEIKTHLQKGEEKFQIDSYELKQKYFSVKILPKEGFSMGEFKYGFVFIKSVLDEDMIPEGFMRETVRRIQVLRKEMELKKQDKIKLIIESKDLKEYLKGFEQIIKDKTGADKLSITDKSEETLEHSSEDKIKGKILKLFAQKIKS